MKKREFQIHKIDERKNLDTDANVKEFRDNTCLRQFTLGKSQALLSNFINPKTPFRGLLEYWGTGVGKTGGAIAVAEKFKPNVEKYGTKIHVLVPGPLTKQNFINEIIKSTGETYFKEAYDKTAIVTEIETAKMRKNAVNIISQYYRIMSYRSFYRKVLGEKIIEKDNDFKNKLNYKKTDEGDYERDISLDRIYNLDNSLLIVDEAHNLTGNEYGDAVKKIIEDSKNLRILLLSATPMKNLADDIVSLLNYLRPTDSPIERDQVFTSNRNYEMEFKPGGKEYFRKMVRGYVSYLRGADPLTFAERVDKGEIPPGLDFTKMIRCYMEPFQYQTYKHVITDYDDSLDRKSSAVANFVFPGLSKDGKSLVGYYGIEGINTIRSQLKSNADSLTKKIASTVLADFDIPDHSSLLYLTDNKSLSGDIFSEKYLQFFSIKFYTVLKHLNDLVEGKLGTGLVFIYSNLVKVGIELFEEILHRNGYLEYNEHAVDYIVKNDTRCYYCDNAYGQHQAIKTHTFYPATYITITGKSEDSVEQIPEEKHKILKNVFNTPENRDGKYIKFILGSKVMNEGITLKNIKEINILDVHYNLGRVDQVIGRGIRFCTHYDIINDDNMYPTVEVNKYVVSITDNELSSEEKLYQKAEQKYRLIKETERILQEEAIDCPLNFNGNVFKEELKKYKNCGPKNNPCPAICGYMSCQFKCGDKLLNAEYYDPDHNIYRKVEKEKLDYSTYDNSLANEEIEYSKNKIKKMYKLTHLYLLEDIVKEVKQTYPEEKQYMFDDYYVYQALDDLIPVTRNDFNNFKDTILDKFNRPGYLIYRDRYYIFQPFDENETLPMYYRRTNNVNIANKVNLVDYIHQTDTTIDENATHEINNETNERPQFKYDFDSIQDYYDSRDEFNYVGIIDQESTRKKNKRLDEINDEFKIRQKRPKVLSKKRDTGVPSYKGAVCYNSKDKAELEKILAKTGVNKKYLKDSKNSQRIDICKLIQIRLFDLEKYSTSKDKNKMTYLIVPANHKDIPFPLNLEDRLKTIINEVKKKTKMAIDTSIEVIPEKGEFDDITYVSYRIIFDSPIDASIMKPYGAEKKDNKWIITI